jgi:D-arabinose 1-dehydrogenase-like Zn-dependent alcohol dehydrogenase
LAGVIDSDYGIRNPPCSCCVVYRSTRLCSKPQATPGSAIVIPTPLVIGSAAVGRITAVGNNATFLKPGYLIIDIFICDDRDSCILFGYRDGATPSSRTLIAGEWRDETYAEFTKAPLENCYALNEARLLGSLQDGGLVYSVNNLAFISRLVVLYGGLRDIALQAGETITVAPATGAFGGATVHVELEMGRVLLLQAVMEMC